MTMRSAVATALLLSTLASPVWAAGDAARGQSVFTRCTACHAVTEQNKVGPHLVGIIGRPAGSVPGARYSKALPAAGITWTEADLDAYLAAPAKRVPGTSMTVGLPNEQDRADVIAYLKTLPRP